MRPRTVLGRRVLCVRGLDLAENVDTLAGLIGRHPEFFLTGYQADGGLSELAQTADFADWQPLRDACRAARSALLTGFIEDRNAMLGVHGDERAFVAYRKTHLFAGERDVLDAGTWLPCVTLAGSASPR